MIPSVGPGPIFLERCCGSLSAPFVENFNSSFLLLDEAGMGHLTGLLQIGSGGLGVQTKTSNFSVSMEKA